MTGVDCYTGAAVSLPATMPPSALHDVKIVEYASLAAGPYCAKLLADMGAETIKIEPPSGDAARAYGPFAGGEPDPETSSLFLYANTSKLGVTLDPAVPQGRELLLRLLDGADVFVHDLAPARASALGLDFDTLHARDERLIVTAVTPYGSSGPKADAPGHELNLCQAGGEGYLLPGGLGHELFPDAPPLRLGSHAGDYDAGVASAVATMAALLARDIHGVGQLVDVSRQEANLTLNRVTMATYESEGLVTRRANRFYKFGGLFPTKDGYVVLRPTEDNHWAALAHIMGRPDLADDPRFAERRERIRNGAECNAIIAEWSASHTKRAIYEACYAGGCPVGPFYDAKEIAEDPQMAARGFFVEVDHAAAGRQPYPSAPYHFPATPWRMARAAPLLGEHNDLVYRERLGLSTDDLAALRAAGAV